MSFFSRGPFVQQYQAYSGVYIHKEMLDDGVLLPPSALQQIADREHIQWPLMIKVTNPSTGVYTHCGVLEFTADEGVAYFPLWILNQLGIQPGENVRVETTSLSKGTFVKLRPRKKEFVETSNPKVILERKLRNFACLTRGDCITFKYNNKVYEIDVRDVKDFSGPCEAISIVEADINLEFERPLDMPESPTPEQESVSDSLFETPIIFPEKKKKVEVKPQGFVPFGGSGLRIDGKPATPIQSTEPEKRKESKKKIKSKEDYWSSLGSGRSLK